MQGVQITKPDRRVVMRGSLDEFRLSEVLQNASLSRQLTLVDVMDPSAQSVGSVMLKSGHILSAVAGDLSAIPALRKLIRVRKGCHFTISRLLQNLERCDSLGPVECMLQKAVQPVESEKSERKCVMRGTLDQVGLRELCASLSISRRLLEIEALSKTGKVVARLAVKSGFILVAKTTNANGNEALQQLATLQASGFAVYHLDLAGDPEPLCSMAELFTRAEPAPVPAREPPAPEPPPPPPPLPPVAIRKSNGNASPVSVKARTTPIVSVVSPKGGVGKTTIALNLSVALAQRGIKVVLVDMDLQGGTLAALDATNKYTVGIYDVLAGRISLEQAIVPTNISSLSLLPAGEGLNSDSPVDPEVLEVVLAELCERANLVLVDTPAGLRDVTRTVAASSTHLIGVVQAEPLSARAFHQLPNMIRDLGKDAPALLGVVINMLDYRNSPSVATLDSICREAGAEWVFDVPFARTRAFLEASELGVPLGLAGKSAPSATWLFEGLATSVLERLQLLSPRIELARLI